MGPKDLRTSAIISVTELAEFYGVTADYLPDLSHIENYPNADLHDLHLGDEMIGLLKSGRLKAQRNVVMEREAPEDNELNFEQIRAHEEAHQQARQDSRFSDAKKKKQRFERLNEQTGGEWIKSHSPPIFCTQSWLTDAVIINFWITVLRTPIETRRVLFHVYHGQIPQRQL